MDAANSFVAVHLCDWAPCPYFYIDIIIYLHVRRLPHLSAVAGVVQSSHEGPEKFDASCEQFAEISQRYQKQGYSYDGIHYRKGLAGGGCWVYMTVTYKKHNVSFDFGINPNA